MRQTHEYKVACICGKVNRFVILHDPEMGNAHRLQCEHCSRELSLVLGRNGEIARQANNVTKAELLLGEATPDGKSMNAPGAKADSGKPLPWLVLSNFSHALGAVVQIGTAGANKYTPNGWLHVENGEERYMEAFARHTLAVGRGEKIDNGPGGTGGLHKAQMIWNLLAALELELRREAGWSREGKTPNPS